MVTDENGVASFVIGQLNAGKYTLVYSVDDSKSYCSNYKFIYFNC